MEKYPNVNWPEAIKPLLKKYKNEKLTNSQQLWDKKCHSVANDI